MSFLTYDLNNHYLLSFVERAQIPLIVYSKNYKPIFYNEYFNQILDSSEYIDIPRLEKCGKYYLHMPYKKMILKLRFDLALKDDLHYFITVRVVDHIHKEKILDNSLPISTFTKNTSGRDIEITPAELKCLNYIINDKTAKQAAIDLNISPKTVEFHISNVKRKLNCFKITKLAYEIGKYHSAAEYVI